MSVLSIPRVILPGMRCRADIYGICAALLTLLLLTTLPSSPAAAQITVTSDLSTERTVAPGASYEETIDIRNDSNAPQTVRMYVRDYSFSADGSNTYGEPGSLPRSNAEWLTFGPEQRTIPAGETVSAGVTVDVPSADADTTALEGTYWSIIMVEAIEETADTTAEQFQVSTQIRYGVQIITHIGDTGAPKITFDNPQLQTRNDGSRVLQVDLGNTGGRAVVPEVHVELYDSSGNKQGELEVSDSRIYPNTSVRKTFPLEDIPSGTYTALVVADAGNDGAFGAKYQIEV